MNTDPVFSFLRYNAERRARAQETLIRHSLHIARYSPRAGGRVSDVAVGRFLFLCSALIIVFVYKTVPEKQTGQGDQTAITRY